MIGMPRKVMDESPIISSYTQESAKFFSGGRRSKLLYSAKFVGIHFYNSLTNLVPQKLNLVIPHEELSRGDFMPALN